jgi:DNA-nicking Smr family endonuclease
VSQPVSARLVRPLSAEEQALWDRVAATIRPLSRDPIARTAAHSLAPTADARPSVKLAKPAVTPKVAEAPIRPRFNSGLDGHWERRIHGGDLRPDRVLDLHGHNLDGAWRAIDDGLERAIGLGERVVLLVTGHARGGEPPVERGKIRAAVYDWLSASRHSSRIAAVKGAHRRHGGGGSLYIILRR